MPNKKLASFKDLADHETRPSDDGAKFFYLYLPKSLVGRHADIVRCLLEDAISAG